MLALMLTFVACVAPGQPNRCQQVELAFEGTLTECMLLGQHQAAAWTASHPGWVVTRGWRCEAGRSA